MPFLVNPNNAVVRSDTNNMREAAQAKGVQLQIVEARNKTEIDVAFRQPDLEWPVVADRQDIELIQ